MKNILFILIIVTSFFSYSQQSLNTLTSDGLVVQVNPTENFGKWSEYGVFNNVLIEFKLENSSAGSKNEVWMIFKFTNLLSSPNEINWVSTWHRDGECVNCDRLGHYEFAHRLTFQPNETLGEDVFISRDQSFFMFSHFINIYPGMDEKKMTSFQFIKIH